MLVSRVRGRFTRWEGLLYFDAERPEESRVEVAIDAGSIDTGHPARDVDLRGPRFLDVERCPTIGFHSLAIDRAAEARYTMSGEVTIRRVARPILLSVEQVGRMVEPRGLERVGFRAAGALDRRDFGITFNQL